MKIKFSLFFVIFFWISSAQAYPWMFFRESSSSIIQLDSHASYFLNGKTAVFSGFQLAYHNSKIDLDLGYNYSFLEKNHYFQISELSVIFPFLFEDWKMTLGVRDVLWSEADRYWNYGLWQARYLLDPLRPKQLGIPGLYFDHKTDTTSFLLALSYFYIPDVIILPELKNNEIVSKNPFFINSFSQFHWEVEQLDLFEIDRFFKPTLAFRLEHFIENSSINFSYAYKPVNQLRKAVFVKGINLSESSANSLTVTDFKYFVLSHHLMSLEAETKLSQNVSLFVSVFYERPEQEQHEQDWISDSFSPHLTYSVLAYFQEKWEKDKKTLFTLGWTKTVDNQSDLTANPVTSDFRELFNRNFDWKHAIGASIEHENKQLFQGFLFRFRTNYALDNQNYYFVLENYFYLTPHIRLYLAGDLFFRFSNTETPFNSSNINSSNSPDKGKYNRILLGGQYVF
ncbi:MAG: hypothetical protein OXJ52_06830 [Oligoflexia bacterium]|nr:hypothetical protein [Oligoflexia bacterium]